MEKIRGELKKKDLRFNNYDFYGLGSNISPT